VQILKLRVLEREAADLSNRQDAEFVRRADRDGDAPDPVPSSDDRDSEIKPGDASAGGDDSSHPERPSGASASLGPDPDADVALAVLAADCAVFRAERDALLGAVAVLNLSLLCSVERLCFASGCPNPVPLICCASCFRAP
jgi:hypothetical protein